MQISVFYKAMKMINSQETKYIIKPQYAKTQIHILH